MNDILETAILEMGRQKQHCPFSASEILRWVYPQDWQQFFPELLATLEKLQKEGKIDLLDEKGKTASRSPNEKSQILVKG